MTSWNTQQVLELAPDASSSKAAQGLAKLTKWNSLGRSDRAIWGEQQGSGKKPYQTRIDLSEPAFKCSCPSRKFPCKHGLALFLVYADNPTAFAAGDPPGWVADWIDQRDQRHEKRAARQEKAKEVDPEAQAKRIARREKKVRSGIEELGIWLADLARQGLGAAQSQPMRFWDNMAARMVDAQSPGLARYVRQLGELGSSGDGWQERMLFAVGRLYLLLQAYQRVEQLPQALQADVRTCVGWPTSKDELLKRDPVEDQWIVMGQVTSREEQLRVQRTWLLGRRSEHTALILQFAPGNQGFESTLALGTEFDGKLIFYPSARPQRAMIAERGEGGLVSSPPPPGASIDELRSEYAQALAAQPWIERMPMRLAGVTPRQHGEDGGIRWCVVDGTGDHVDLECDDHCAWQLMSISGGAPMDVFGEWNGRLLRPLGATSGDRFFTVVQSEEGHTLTRVA